ncbi:hypothetical protein [Dactylosporangium sp. NPDC000521]|uniref:hypothetical protein n=1 Tax=Dactylosporangium sp. NPDC000521 TaxID=3363975 RepID=UPI0036A1711C
MALIIHHRELLMSTRRHRGRAARYAASGTSPAAKSSAARGGRSGGARAPRCHGQTCTSNCTARIGDVAVEGCDFLYLDERGLIDELTVMARRLSTAQALAAAMAGQFAQIQ